MLKILRHKKTAKKVWIGLALIIIPAFALWGFGGAFSSRQDNKPLGKIFGRQVTDLEFKDSLSAVTTSAIMRFGDKLPEVEKYLNLEAQAWQRLVLLEEAKRRGIKASDKEIVDFIESLPYFQYKGGFDNKTYDQTLRYAFRLKARAFEEQTRQNLILNKLYKQITDNLKINDKDADQAYDKENQEISVYYIASLIADFTKTIKPQESELKDYFEKNKETFRQPISTDKEKKETLIPEFQSVKQKVKDTLVNAEAMKKAEEKINQCAQELKTREFKDAAKKCGLKVKGTPAFKFGVPIEGVGPSDKFWEAAKALKPEQASQIIKLPAGFYIVKIKSILPRDEKKYQKEKPEYRERLLNQKKDEVFNQFIIELNKKAG
ncbi:MAG: SurA N-terminal domain-containing protein [Candidatus Omnitrophota bacterium]|nr:SurA N-terminal domain-containing protein [Candidatus Omnitrophota bacterium]